MYLINLKKKSLIFLLISFLMILLAIILTILIYFITKTTTDIYYIQNWENLTLTNNYLRFKLEHSIKHNENKNNNNNNNHNNDDKNGGDTFNGGTATITGDTDYIDNENDRDDDDDDDDGAIYIDGDNDYNSNKNIKIKPKNFININNNNIKNDNYFDNSGSGDYNLNNNNNFYSVSSEFVSNLRQKLKITTPRTTIVVKKKPTPIARSTLIDIVGGGNGFGLNLKINRKQHEYDDNLTEKIQINNFKKRERDREESDFGSNDGDDETGARRILGNVKKSEEKSHQILLCENRGGGELCRMLFKGHVTN